MSFTMGITIKDAIKCINIHLMNCTTFRKKYYFYFYKNFYLHLSRQNDQKIEYYHSELSYGIENKVRFRE